MIKNIIFDFGGVILKHKAAITIDILSAIFPDSSMKVEEIWKKYKTLLNTGKKSSNDLLLELKNNIPTKLSIDELKFKWKELYKKEASIDLELLNFIEKLKHKYKVYLFTDTIDIHDEYNKARNIYEKFYRVYRSFKEGVAKSEGKVAFINFIKKMQINSSESIFIDDLEKYVQAARNVGMKGIVYKNFLQFKDELTQEGIKI